MPYSNPLDPTTPSSTALRSEGDDRIREAKAAIRERLLTIFQNVDANPLAFIAGIIPNAALGSDIVITTARLDNLAVTTPKVADSAITTPKVADDAITFAKLLTAMRSKMPQFRSAIVSLPSLTAFAAGSVTDFAAGISVTAGTFNHIAGLSSVDSGFPSAALKLSVVQNMSTGALSLRVHNISSGAVTLSALYSVGIWIVEPLS